MITAIISIKSIKDIMYLIAIYIFYIRVNGYKFYCTQPHHAEMTKLLCPHHEGAGSPHPIRVGGPDLWYHQPCARAVAVGVRVRWQQVSYWL